MTCGRGWQTARVAGTQRSPVSFGGGVRACEAVGASAATSRAAIARVRPCGIFGDNRSDTAKSRRGGVCAGSRPAPTLSSHTAPSPALTVARSSSRLASVVTDPSLRDSTRLDRISTGLASSVSEASDSGCSSRDFRGRSGSLEELRVYLAGTSEQSCELCDTPWARGADIASGSPMQALRWGLNAPTDA